MKNDFQVDDKVLEKFSEKKNEKNNDRSAKKISSKKNLVKSKQKAINKDVRPRKAIKPERKRLLVKKKQKSFQYPEDYPEDLIEFDERSVDYWKEFNTRFFTGEKTMMDITYMGISTGKITIETKSDTQIGGKDVYHVQARVKTADFYSYLYELDDYCDSYISKNSHVPVKFSLIQRESSQDIDDLQLFDAEKLKTYSLYKRVTDKKTKKSKKENNTPKYFQDPLSIVYFLRGMNFALEKEYIVPVINQGKVEVLTAKLIGHEEIETEIGKKKALKVSIFTRAKGKTIAGGNMTFWFSDDDRRIFLRFKAKIKIGSISGEIISYSE